MPNKLKITIGQHTDKGRKDINQDYYGVCTPAEPQLSSKGIAIALADGISSSDVGQVASQTAVSSFLQDYYCTSDAWSVMKSCQRVLMATNSWLYSQTMNSQHRYNKDRGYVCTFSALVIKSTTAHIFHLGDARVYRLRAETLEQLTTDHRVWVSPDKSYLSRALGVSPHIEFDYKAVPMLEGDIFLLATDGVYEHLTPQFTTATVRKYAHDIDMAARLLVDAAYAQGSTDNLSVQVVRIDALPEKNANDILQQLSDLPFPPILNARSNFDGYKIIREVHASSRSHVYLATDPETNTSIIIKTPSIDLQGDPAYLERFLLEEWIARRIDSPHVLKPCVQTRPRNFLYVAFEYVEGQTLRQWMLDHVKPDLETVRGIIEQIAKGLRAFHRMDMLHQDLRPENIIIDTTGTLKIIDFGSTRVAGLMEISTPIAQTELLGTEQYSAPEYYLGETGTSRSDMFSLAVITYQMLTGQLPYGTQVPKARTRAAQRDLRYDSLLNSRRDIPVWVDEALRKALHPLPQKRYEDISEFLFDLRLPNKAFLNKARTPLIERNPAAFWKGVSILLLIIIGVLLLRG